MYVFERKVPKDQLDHTCAHIALDQRRFSLNHVLGAEGTLIVAERHHRNWRFGITQIWIALCGKAHRDPMIGFPAGGLRFGTCLRRWRQSERSCVTSRDKASQRKNESE